MSTSLHEQGRVFLLVAHSSTRWADRIECICVAISLPKKPYSKGRSYVGAQAKPCIEDRLERPIGATAIAVILI